MGRRLAAGPDSDLAYLPRPLDWFGQVYKDLSDRRSAAVTYRKELIAWKALDPELVSHFASDIGMAQAALRRCEKASASN